MTTTAGGQLIATAGSPLSRIKGINFNLCTNNVNSNNSSSTLSTPSSSSPSSTSSAAATTAAAIVEAISSSSGGGGIGVCVATNNNVTTTTTPLNSLGGGNLQFLGTLQQRPMNSIGSVIQLTAATPLIQATIAAESPPPITITIPPDMSGASPISNIGGDIGCNEIDVTPDIIPEATSKQQQITGQGIIALQGNLVSRMGEV